MGDASSIDVISVSIFPSPVSIHVKLYLGNAETIFSHVLLDGDRFSLIIRVIVTLLEMPIALLKEFLFNPSSSMIFCIRSQASIYRYTNS